MKFIVISRCCWAPILISLLFSGHSLADKRGHERHHQQSHDFQREDHSERDWEERSGEDVYRERPFFSDNHRQMIGRYYEDEYRSGRCPPGLAKKHNSCLPPGQTKRWMVGRPLPRNVVYYDLPQVMIQQLGYPPAGYRFVRVAGDILLIAIASGMVVDAITDLNGR